MQKIILDTNVIVSALISNAAPSKILYEHIFTKSVQCCLSDAVFQEYIDVLNRDKFSRIISFKSNADIVLHKLTEISSFYQPERSVDILKDMDDNKFLELAVASSANYLITGNTNDFTISSFGKTQIISPAEYWKKTAY